MKITWFKPKIDSKLLKNLMQRRDGPGWLNTILYFTSLLLTGYIAYLSWGTWWALPAFFIYGSIRMRGDALESSRSETFKNATICCLTRSELRDTASRKWKPLILPQIPGTSLCEFLCILHWILG